MLAIAFPTVSEFLDKLTAAQDVAIGVCILVFGLAFFYFVKSFLFPEETEDYNGYTDTEHEDDAYHGGRDVGHGTDDRDVFVGYAGDDYYEDEGGLSSHEVPY